MTRFILTLALACLWMCTSAHEAFTENCFGIIAGKNATQTGCVLMGHNEDDGGEQMLNMNVVSGDASKGINKFIWAEFLGMEVADAFMNEYGVCVASDNCQSCEDREDYTEGGILFNIRMDVAKYAKSARDAVHVIARNVEKYGYRSSGRSYLVADPEEGWVVSLVQGRHWVAQRVPDDMVMSIPNYYVIGEIDLTDTLNYLGSKDIVSYAIERGWYDPQRDGKFNFRKAYAAEKTMTRTSNSNRHSRVLAMLAGGKYDYTVQTAPFAIRPAKKLGVQDVIDALSIHMEPTAQGTEEPCVCTQVTVLSIVCELRSWLPRNMGCIMWTCPGRPCTNAFIPWYLGMTKSPKGWQRYSKWEKAEQNHFADKDDKRIRFPHAAYWQYVDKKDALGKHLEKGGNERDQLYKTQQEIFNKQQCFDAEIQKVSTSKLNKKLNAFTAQLIKTYHE